MIRFASTSLPPRHLGEPQRLLVQRLAGDRRLAARVTERPDVVGGPHAAARDHRSLGQAEDTAIETQVGALERAVAVDRGTEETLDARLPAGVDRRVDAETGRPLPAVRPDDAA